MSEVVKNRISIHQIERALYNIEPCFLNSDQYVSESLSKKLGVNLILKIETINPVRSFKARGTEHFIFKYAEATPLVCASAGNFGMALAYSCRKKNLSLTVFTSMKANSFKIEGIKEMGADVILFGNDFEESKAAAKQFAEENNFKFVEDTLDIETVEGAGTIGIELVAFPQKIDNLIISLGNGALLTGVASIFKRYSPFTKIAAVQSERAPAMIQSLKFGKIIMCESDTIADGIAVKIPIPQALADLDCLIDEDFTVSDDSLLYGMKLLKDGAGIIAEPSAAAGIAAILENADHFKNKTVAVIICGGNFRAEDHS